MGTPSRLLAMTTGPCLLAAVATGQGVQMKSITSYPAGTLPRAAALADMDGGGDLDVVLTGEAPARVAVLYNTRGSLSTGPSLPLGLPSRVGRLAAADLDGDGDIDLAATHRQGTLVLVENVGGALAIRSSMSLSSAPDDIVAGDLDGDGDFDLVVTGEYGGELHALWNQGGFAFATQSHAMPLGTASLALGRVTGRGPLDVVVACSDSDQVLVFTPIYLQAWLLVGLPPVALDHVYPRDVSVGDVDGNGFADLVAVGLTYQGFTLGRAQVVLSQGAGGFQKLGSFWPKPGPVGSCAL